MPDKKEKPGAGTPRQDRQQTLAEPEAHPTVVASPIKMFPLKQWDEAALFYCIIGGLN